MLSVEDGTVILAFRRQTLLPLDDCLYALQPTPLYLTRSSLHRCLQRHGINRLPEVEEDKPARRKFKAYPIGYYHVGIAELRTAEGKLYLFLAFDRTSKIAYAELHAKAGTTESAHFLHNFVATVPMPYTQSSRTTVSRPPPSTGSVCARPYLRSCLLGKRHRTLADQGPTPLDQWPG